jgi:hypothetical protein
LGIKTPAISKIYDGRLTFGLVLRGHLTYDALMNTVIKTSWTTYDLEAIIEHAIVHILRHRLQIEKMIVKYEILNNDRDSRF